jgi:hypothetical protein
VNTSTPTFRLGWALLATGACLFWGTAAADASALVRAKLRPVAETIVKLLDEEKQQAVAILDFPPDPRSGSNAGPGIQQCLTDELEAQRKGVVQTKANFVIKGHYTGVDLEDNLKRNLRVVKVTLNVLNRQDKSVLEKAVIIDSNEDIARLLNVTGELPLNANREDLNRKIKEQIDDPKVFIEGTKIAPSLKSPYRVEVLVKGPGAKQSAARSPILKDGQAFVDINRGDIYEVRIHNLSEYDTAITLAIDGLDVYTFSEDRDAKGNSRFSHYIIGARQVADILGWHKTIEKGRSDNVISFLVTDYGKGAASQKKAIGKVGVITVTFAAAWNGDARPPDEPRSRNAGGYETGFGPPRKVDFQPVRRTIGNIREQVSVRYSR